MAYIGREPQIGNYQICDAISVVNGQAAYTMQVNSSNVIPESVNHMIVSLNGVIQKPGSSYTISSSTITFASNLATGDSIDFIYLLGNTLDIGVPSDSTITSAKLSGALVTPSTLDVNGNELILDADADTSITADTDDTIHVKTGGSDRVTVNDTGLAVGTTPEAPLTVGSNNSGGQGVVGKQALFSGTNTSTYNAGNSGTWGGITIVNQDNTSNRTGTGITFVNRSSSSGLAGIQSTNDGTAERADLRFITRGAGGTVAERMRIDDDGRVICPEGITLGTAVGTYAAANTMDDYEEGTFTPDTNIGFSSVVGEYVKIGKMVHFAIQGTFNAGPGDGSQASSITGLPFSASPGDQLAEIWVVTHNEHVIGQVGGTSIGLKGRGDGINITRGQIGSKGFQATGTYHVDL